MDLKTIHARLNDPDDFFNADDAADMLECIAAVLDGDPEAAHSLADRVLLRLANDWRVEEAWEKVPRWYA